MSFYHTVSVNCNFEKWNKTKEYVIVELIHRYSEGSEPFSGTEASLERASRPHKRKN